MEKVWVWYCLLVPSLVWSGFAGSVTQTMNCINTKGTQYTITATQEDVDAGKALCKIIGYPNECTPWVVKTDCENNSNEYSNQSTTHRPSNVLYIKNSSDQLYDVANGNWCNHDWDRCLDFAKDNDKLGLYHNCKKTSTSVDCTMMHKFFNIPIPPCGEYSGQYTYLVYLPKKKENTGYFKVFRVCY